MIAGWGSRLMGLEAPWGFMIPREVDRIFSLHEAPCEFGPPSIAFSMDIFNPPIPTQKPHKITRFNVEEILEQIMEDRHRFMTLLWEVFNNVNKRFDELEIRLTDMEKRWIR